MKDSVYSTLLSGAETISLVGEYISVTMDYVKLLHVNR